MTCAIMHIAHCIIMLISQILFLRLVDYLQKQYPSQIFHYFILDRVFYLYLNPATSTPDREGEDLGVHLKLLSLLENPAVIVAAAAYCHSQRLPLQTPSRCTYKY